MQKTFPQRIFRPNDDKMTEDEVLITGSLATTVSDSSFPVEDVANRKTSSMAFELIAAKFA